MFPVPTWYLLLHVLYTIIFIQSHILRLQMGSTSFNLKFSLFWSWAIHVQNPSDFHFVCTWSSSWHLWSRPQHCTIIMIMMTIILINGLLYRVSQKKRNSGFSVPCKLKVWYIFTSLDKVSSPEQNDTKIIKCGWVILILCPFLEIQSFFKYSLDFGDRQAKNCEGKSLPYSVLWKPIDPCFFCFHGSMGFPKHLMEALSRHNSSLIGRKNQAKFEKWLYFKKWV